MSQTNLIKAILPGIGLARGTVVRHGKMKGVATGGIRGCACSGFRVAVRWSNGKLTWPCLKGMDEKWSIEDAGVK